MSESMQIVRDVCKGIKDIFQSAAFWSKSPREHRNETALMDYIQRSEDNPKFVKKALNEIENGKANLAQTNIHGFDALSLAVRYKQPQILKALIQKGAPLDVVHHSGCQGQTALDMAMARTSENFGGYQVYREMAEILIDAGAIRAQKWDSKLVSQKIAGQDVEFPPAPVSEITWPRVTDAPDQPNYEVEPEGQEYHGSRVVLTGSGVEYVGPDPELVKS